MMSLKMLMVLDYDVQNYDDNVPNDVPDDDDDDDDDDVGTEASRQSRDDR